MEATSPVEMQLAHKQAFDLGVFIGDLSLDEDAIRFFIIHLIISNINGTCRCWVLLSYFFFLIVNAIGLLLFVVMMSHWMGYTKNSRNVKMMK